MQRRYMSVTQTRQTKMNQRLRDRIYRGWNRTLHHSINLNCYDLLLISICKWILIIIFLWIICFFHFISLKMNHYISYTVYTLSILFMLYYMSLPSFWFQPRDKKRLPIISKFLTIKQWDGKIHFDWNDSDLDVVKWYNRFIYWP